MNPINIIFIIGVIIYFIVTRTVDKKFTSDLKFINSNDKTVSRDVLLIQRFEKLAKNIIVQNGFAIDYLMIIAIIRQESSYRSLRENNSDIIGDTTLKNHALGYMQVRLPALLDVNNNYGFDLSQDDILADENNNILAGAGYLNICYMQAIKDKPQFHDTRWLAFKKYNGGVGIKEGTFNSSNRFADSTLKYYKKFMGIVA